MKFAYNLEAADIIGRELAALLPALHPDTLVVPIPTSTTHVRARGFDHAQKIAQYVAKDSNLHPLNALRRTDQKRQVGASRATRVQQIRGIFRVVSSVKNAHILLVDDVITTGATIEEAARTLKNAGAKTINAVVFAKTV
jgi:ComF family protein